LLSWIPSFSVCQIAGLACAVAAIVLGLLARRRAQAEYRPQGLALAGQITGFVGAGLCATFFASCQYCSYKMGQAMDSAREELKQAAKSARWDGGGLAPASLPVVREGLTLCTEVVAGRCHDPARRFVPSEEMIHAVYVPPPGGAGSDARPGGGRRYMVIWIAEEVGGALEPGTSLGTSSGRLHGAGRRVVKGTLARPGRRWPLGRYKVAVTIDGRVTASARFRVAEGDEEVDDDDAGP
jgi:hypothetical protein